MSTVVGKTQFKYEKSTVRTSFLWKCDGHSFHEYLDFLSRSKVGITSTEEIHFQTGFLACTNHYVKCYITPDDCNVYVKIYMKDTVLLSEFTNFDISTPKVAQSFGTGIKVVSPLLPRLTDATKNSLISKGYFTEEDFSNGKRSKVYWFHYRPSEKANTPLQIVQYFYKVDTITFTFDFKYCFWNKTQIGMQLGFPDDENYVVNAAGSSNTLLALKDYLFSSKFSDFIIQSGSKSFNVHRMIISNQSVVFAAMLEQPLKESKEGKLTIDDFETDSVEEFIRFMYTGNANINEYALDLFKLSNKYEVVDLKNISEAALIANLDKANLVHIFELAKMYNSERLKDKCYSFFKLHRSSLLKTKADVEKLSDFILDEK